MYRRSLYCTHNTGGAYYYRSVVVPNGCTDGAYTVHIILLALPKYRRSLSTVYCIASYYWPCRSLTLILAYIPAEPNTNTCGAYRNVPTDAHMILLAYNSTTSTTKCTPTYRWSLPPCIPNGCTYHTAGVRTHRVPTYLL